MLMQHALTSSRRTPYTSQALTHRVAVQADFRSMVVAQRGFIYRPERPQLARFEEQKWGWASEQPGGCGRGTPCTVHMTPCQCRSARICHCSVSHACFSIPARAPPCPLPNPHFSIITSAGSWVEIEVDTRPRPAQSASGSNHSLAGAQAVVLVGHLRSYVGMGAAAVDCRSGCTCRPSTLDGTSASRASVFKIHSFKVWFMPGASITCRSPAGCPGCSRQQPPGKQWLVSELAGRLLCTLSAALGPTFAQVTQHRRCRFRVTVLEEPGATPQEGHKVMLAAVMVEHSPKEQAWS